MEVIFYGPFGGRSGKIIGGGESGNKKTVHVMNELDLSVIQCEKPYPLKSRIGICCYPFQLLFSFFNFLYLLVTVRSEKSVHVSGFYNHLIYIEWLLISTAKILGINAVYEVRAGGMIESYESGSRLYKYFFKRTLNSASFILCQGKEYVPFVGELTAVPALYYPNFLLNKSYQKYDGYGREQLEHIRLVYFGRVAESKNIEFIIDVCLEVNKSFSVDLEIIGSGDEEYEQRLHAKIDLLGLRKNVVMSGRCKPDDLMQKLSNKHFFIFPTVEQREGHSNSLTEAMSRGVVPIASDIGFNRSIVNNGNLIVNEFNPRFYAEKISDIVNERKWTELSKEVHFRIGTHYTERAIRDVLSHVHSNGRSGYVTKFNEKHG